MMAAMFFTSVVFTFRDCFEPPEKSGPQALHSPVSDSTPGPDGTV